MKPINNFQTANPRIEGNQNVHVGWILLDVIDEGFKFSLPRVKSLPFSRTSSPDVLLPGRYGLRRAPHAEMGFHEGDVGVVITGTTPWPTWTAKRDWGRTVRDATVR